MKKVFFSILLVSLNLASCKEKQVVSQDDIDKHKIVNYLEQNKLEAESHPSGIYYIISKPGGDAKPEVSSTITVAYDGKLLDGSRFDRSENFTYLLSSLIKGWQIGIPLIGEGGEIKLFIPSTLGYGSQSKPRIPANSVLIFDITLISFSN